MKQKMNLNTFELVLIHSTGTAWSVWKEDRRIRWGNSTQTYWSFWPKSLWSRCLRADQRFNQRLSRGHSIWPDQWVNFGAPNLAYYMMLINPISYIGYISGMMEPIPIQQNWWDMYTFLLFSHPWALKHFSWNKPADCSTHPPCTMELERSSEMA